jgi:hypothetical protein
MWLARKDNLEDIRTNHARAGPEGDTPRPIGLVVGPVPPPGGCQLSLLLGPSSTAYEEQSKPPIRSV